MQKGWSILFGVVLGATFLIWVVAPFVGWWLPRNVASFGGEVDLLFYLILGFTGFFFLLTEVLLVYVMYRYAYAPGRRAIYVEGDHRLEIAWTVVPALILLFIAFAQVKAWEHIKYQTRMPEPDMIVQADAMQWQWRFRYLAPSDPEKGPLTPETEGERARWVGQHAYDDLQLPSELHTWKGAKVKIYLQTRDVLHSLYVPNLRLKQDALPGRIIPMWFEATEANVRYNESTHKVEYLNPDDVDSRWEIACAELCGTRHYAMRARFYVHENEGDYRAWLGHARQEEQSHEVEKPAEPVAWNR